MTGDEYRARSAALLAAADASPGDAAFRDHEALASHWRSLAVLADWQDATLAALAGSGD